MNKRYIDRKYTIWERTYYPKSVTNEELKAAIDSNTLYKLDELYSEEIGDIEPLSVANNNGEATVELYLDDNLIYANNK